MVVHTSTWLNYSFAGNMLREYVMAAIIFIVVFLVLKIFKKIIIVKLHRIAKKTKTDIDDFLIKVLDEIGWPLYVIVPLWFAVRTLQMPQILDTGVTYLTLIILTFYAILSLTKALEFGANRYVKEREKREKEVDRHVLDLLIRIAKGILWAIATLLVLANLGYDVTTLIAGLGIGGLAVAFALQNILSDMFASFSIYFDKPFKLGDFIVFGDKKGTVEKIGIKSTRLKTLLGDELVVSNRELTETQVHNYKKMKKRRISFSFGVTYDTSTKKMKKIPGMVQKIIDKIEVTDFDRAHFTSFGDFSLNFDVVYYLKKSEYRVFMDTQQEINLKIMEAFKKEKIEMAFPTQTIYLEK